MTTEEIEQNKKELGEVKNKIVIHFSDKGVGVDSTETGVSPAQVIQGILALCSVLKPENFTEAISHLGDFPKIIALLKATTEVLSNKSAKEKQDEKDRD